MLILPHALREHALKKRGETNYQKLWDDISNFNQRLGVTAQGHLEYFLKAFQKELDEFVAEFECVPGQVGAIILIDDRVVGIERAPSQPYWQSIWPCLIRECYGSLATEAPKSKHDDAAKPSARSQLPLEIESLDELESLIVDIAAQEDERARSTVRELLDDQLELQHEENVAGVSIDTVTSENFAGQVIREGDKVVYASLPATGAFVERQEWTRAKPFVI